MIPIRLETMHFPEGYRLEPDDPGVMVARLPADRLIREAVELADPLFMKFINCQSDADIKSFLAQFWDEPRVDLGGFKGRITTLRSLALNALDENRDTEAADFGLINGYLSGASLGETFGARLRRVEGQPTLMLVTTSPWEFMLFEIAIAVAAGASIGSCIQCQKRVLHGPATGRRSTGRYCSVACKSAFNRADKKGAAS